MEGICEPCNSIPPSRQGCPWRPPGPCPISSRPAAEDPSDARARPALPLPAASRPKSTGCRGSNPICCLPLVARKAKSGLHPSMQAMRLSRWTNLRLPRAPAVSDRMGSTTSSTGRPKTPVRTDVPARLMLCPPEPSKLTCGKAKAPISLDFWNANTDMRAQASTSGSAVFNESLLRCQVLNHAIFRPAFDLDKISHLAGRHQRYQGWRGSPDVDGHRSLHKNKRRARKAPIPPSLASDSGLSRARFPARP